MRLDVYTHMSSGANMVEYWHWHSIHAGQETYWKGVLSHDLEPNRAYAEVSRTAHELEKIGPAIANLKIRNDVAILYSVDSQNAISFMPMEGNSTMTWEPGKGQGTYVKTLTQLHKALYQANVGADFVFPETKDFSAYKLLIVPPLYIADEALLQRISTYVKNGGHVLMTFKSGFANENSAVRWERAPGPLRDAAGFTYQEFSNLEAPLALKGDPLHAGEENKVNTWAEFLQPTTAEPLAFYDHPFFGRWPAITRNKFGSGSLTYEGTLLSDTLQAAVVQNALAQSGITATPGKAASPVRVKSGVNSQGRPVHFLLNYSSAPAAAGYSFGAGKDLLTGRAVAAGQSLTVAPWDLMIVEESMAR